MARIFISYRRSDSSLVANQIYERLRKKFGKANISKDIDQIDPKQDFRDILRQEATDCRVMLIIIGPNWVNAIDSNGNRCLDNSDDSVRLELEKGLHKDGI